MAPSWVLPLATGLLLPAYAAGGEAAAAPKLKLEAEGEAIDIVRVDPETGFLRDAKGRARIFHGMNVVYKEAPWYPPSGNFTTDDSLDPETMDLMHRWGFNVVRLGVMWPGVEPAKGQIDQSYLKAVTDISKDLAKRGIYTLVDLHQDVGSRRFCGEGFPEFYIDELAADNGSAFAQAPAFPSPRRFEMAVDEKGYPLLSECLKHEFAGYYITNKVGAMWAEFYRPGSPLNEGFLRYWGAVSRAFAQMPQVVGYELLNEPSGLCLEPGRASCFDIKTVTGNTIETEKLTPLYQAAAKAIRKEDRSTPIFYEATVEPKVKGDVFNGPVLSDDPQQGLAYHTYCLPGDGDNFHSAWMCKRAQDYFTSMYHGFLRKNKGVAGFLTEFGAVAGNNPGELDHLARLLDKADDEFQSWAYWMLKKYGDFTTANSAESLYDDEGKLNVEKLKILSRTYAPAIAGTPTKMSYNSQTGAFLLKFTATVAEAPTVVFLNRELNYPSGYQVEVSPEDCLVQSQAEENYLEFRLKAGASCKGGEVTIRLARNSTDIQLIV